MMRKKNIFDMFSSVIVLLLFLGSGCTNDSFPERKNSPLVPTQSSQQTPVKTEVNPQPFMPLLPPISHAQTIVIRVQPSVYAQLPSIISPVHVINYNSFIWLELSTADLPIVQNATMPFEMVENPFQICIQIYCFDPLVSEPELPDKLKIKATDGSSLNFIQFIGPTKDEWLDEFRSMNIKALQYYAENSYLVWAATKDLQQILKKPFVRWVGPYHVAYRISPNLLSAIGRINAVNIVLYDDGNLVEYKKNIESMGGEIYQWYPSSDGFQIAIFSIDAGQIMAIAKLPAVVSLSIQGQPTTTGE